LNCDSLDGDDPMADKNRRRFLRNAGIMAALSSIPSAMVVQARPNPGLPPSTEKKAFPFELGMASYTFRAFTLEQTIAMTQRLGLKTLSLKDVHLPLTSSDQQIQAALSKLRQAELSVDSCGVIYMKTEAEIAPAFAYAKKVGVKTIIGAPDPPLLPIVERFVKESGIALAIHNHGVTDKNFPSPESAYKAVAKMDPGMGLCIDVGHTLRMGLDPIEQFTQYFDRVLDVHLKDVSAPRPDGKDVEVGRGVMNVPAFLTSAVRQKYAGSLHFEFEKDKSDPLPGVAESVGYSRGVLAAI
jgi:inosose dehydratase